MPFDVFYKSAHYEDNEEVLPTVSLVKILNDIADQLPSVCSDSDSYPAFVGKERGRIGILFKDDPAQHSFVLRSNMPVGWRQIALVTHILEERSDNSLVLLDEPDAHLHPSLQRVLLSQIATIANRKQLQIIIATHSPVLINPQLTARHSIKVLLAARGRLTTLSEQIAALDDLGVKASDIIHANGVIWVEGPSDRIYVKHWLNLCAETQGCELIEGIDYVFSFYGGAALKHVSVTGADGRMPVGSVNRNYFFIIDSDLAREDQVIGAEKQRILHETMAGGNEASVWVTEGYTIEDYLPDAYRKYIDLLNGRTVVNCNKVSLARKFSESEAVFENSYRPGMDLGDHILRLLSLILKWQTPQEVIEAKWHPLHKKGTIGRPLNGAVAESADTA